MQVAARGLGAQHPVRVRPDRAALGARQPDRAVPQQQGQYSTVQYSTDRPVSQQHGQNSAVQCRTVQYMVRTVQQLKL